MIERKRERSIKEDAAVISEIIAGELKSWIPEKGVEDFNFKWSQLWDSDWWFMTEHWGQDYIYLNRPDWFQVTVQRCEIWYKWEYTYWTVYIERNITDRIWIPGELVHDNQGTCHTFRWVRSLKHALRLGEICWELMTGLANPEDYFLTRDEYDNRWKLH